MFIGDVSRHFDNIKYIKQKGEKRHLFNLHDSCIETSDFGNGFERARLIFAHIF